MNIHCKIKPIELNDFELAKNVCLRARQYPIQYNIVSYKKIHKNIMSMETHDKGLQHTRSEIEPAAECDLIDIYFYIPQ